MINVAVIGCGGFVRHMHVGNLMADDRFRIRATVDVDLVAAQGVAEESGAAYWTDEVAKVLSDDTVDMVLIATPHHTHAELSIRAAQAGKHVFCEKPMGLNEEECLAVADAVCGSGVKYTVGYNRAMAPFVLKAREILAPLQAPMLIYHRMADWNPYSKGWVLDERRSGGRVIGEGGHGLDMICQLAGQDPVRIYAEGGNFAEPSPTGAPDSVIVTLGFPDGSSGVEFLSSVANNAFPKEEVQITCANHTIVIYGFERLAVYTPEREQIFSLPEVDKGHRALMDAFARAILEDSPLSVGLDQALRTSRCTFAAVRAIRTRQLQDLGENDQIVASDRQGLG